MKSFLFASPAGGGTGMGLIILILLPIVIIAAVAFMKSSKKEREMESLGLDPIDLARVKTQYTGFDIFLNILWHIPFGGFIVALFTALGGLFWCITIIGLPLGLGLLQYAKFLLWPHGHVMMSKKFVRQLTDEKPNVLWKSFSLIVRIVYFPFGLINVISLAIVALFAFISIIGIPQGLVYIKSLGTVFNPVNKICVPAVATKILEERMISTVGKKNIDM
ncbi:MAG: YccF domain-containing protein [Dysgonamonadaceae bacterium]